MNKPTTPVPLAVEPPAEEFAQVLRRHDVSVEVLALVLVGKRISVRELAEILAEHDVRRAEHPGHNPEVPPDPTEPPPDPTEPPPEPHEAAVLRVRVRP